MKFQSFPFRILMVPFLLAILFAAQTPRPASDEESVDTRLPNGKMQKDGILKAEHAQSLKDAAELVRLSEELKAELEKNDRFVVSVPSLKKTEEIEKLAKRIRTRLKRY